MARNKINLSFRYWLFKIDCNDAQGGLHDIAVTSESLDSIAAWYNSSELNKHKDDSNYELYDSFSHELYEYGVLCDM